MADNDIYQNASDAPGKNEGTVEKPQVPSPPPPPPPPTIPPIGGNIMTGAKNPTDQQNIPQSKPSEEPQSSQGEESFSTVTSPSPKRKIPKVIVILGALLGMGLIALVIYKFFLPTDKGEQTITWWGLWEEESVIKPLIDEYQNKNPNIKIDYVKQSPQDYRERLTSSLAKGNGPDIFRIHNTWVPMFNNDLDNVPASFMSTADYAQTYFRVVASDMSSGVGLVGVPLGYDALALYINEDIFTSEGIEAPKNWVDVRETAKRLTRKDEKGVITQAGISLGRTENVDHWPEILALMMIQNGVNLANPTGNLAEDAITFYTLFSRVDKVWDETQPPSTIAFASGKLAMYIGPSWRAFEIKQQNPDLKFRTVAVPQVPKDDPKEPDVTYATYWVEGVWARSPSKEASWDFLKYLSSKDTLEKFYQNASKLRGFGEAYPRVDMTETLKEHPVLGSIVLQAPDARSWYLADRTFDGPTGINTQMKKYFEDAVNAVNLGEDVEDALVPVSEGVKQVLAQYGLIKR